MNHSLYFFALIPDEAFSAKLSQIQEALKKSFGLKYAMRLPPHITLQAPFECQISDEERLQQVIEEIQANLKPLQLKADGLGSFIHSVVYVKVQEAPELKELQQTISGILECKRCLNPAQRNNDYIPHLTLAHRDLEQKRFDEVWEFASQFELMDAFRILKLQIYKYDENGWTEFHAIPLDPVLA